MRAEQTEIVTRPLGLAWAPEMFSLAHIALPFPPMMTCMGESLAVVTRRGAARDAEPTG